MGRLKEALGRFADTVEQTARQTQETITMKAREVRTESERVAREVKRDLREATRVAQVEIRRASKDADAKLRKGITANVPGGGRVRIKRTRGRGVRGTRLHIEFESGK